MSALEERISNGFGEKEVNEDWKCVKNTCDKQNGLWTNILATSNAQRTSNESVILFLLTKWIVVTKAHSFARKKKSTLEYYKMFYSLVIVTESFPYTFVQPSYTYTKSHTSCFCNQLESTNQNTVYISMCVNVYQYTSWYIQSITISQYVSHITMYISPLRTIYVALWYRLGSWQTPMIHVI